MKKLIKHLKNKKILIKFIPITAILIILLGTSLYTVFIKHNSGEDTYVYKEEAVKKGDLIQGIVESGSISLEVSSLDYNLTIYTEDEETEEEDTDDEDEETINYLEIEDAYVVSGQRITEGEALFKLTEDSIWAVSKKLKTLTTEAQIAYQEAETEYKIELLQAKSTYDTSLLEANKAQNSYDASTTKTQENINSLTAENKVLEAKISYNKEKLTDEELWDSLEEAQTAYTSAKNIYTDTEVHNATAYASNYEDYKSAKEQLETIQNQVDQLEDEIEENEKKISKNNKKITEYQSGINVESISNKGAYDSAVLGGELAEEIYNDTISSLEEAVTSAKADMEEAQTNQEELENFVGSDGIVYANGTGMVTEVLYGESDDLINKGAMVSYVKEEAFTVSIDVSEEDISAIKVGDSVDIIIRAYPDTAYKGTVLSITTAATSDYAITVSYPVIIKIEGDTSKLYGGMTAEATFVTDSVSDVLYVSRKAVQEIDGKSYVYIKDIKGSRKMTQVETGFSDGTNIEITSGLKEGDTVFIEVKSVSQP